MQIPQLITATPNITSSSGRPNRATSSNHSVSSQLQSALMTQPFVGQLANMFSNGLFYSEEDTLLSFQFPADPHKNLQHHLIFTFSVSVPYHGTSSPLQQQQQQSASSTAAQTNLFMTNLWMQPAMRQLQQQLLAGQGAAGAVHNSTPSPQAQQTMALLAQQLQVSAP